MDGCAESQRALLYLTLPGPLLFKIKTFASMSALAKTVVSLTASCNVPMTILVQRFYPVVIQPIPPVWVNPLKTAELTQGRIRKPENNTAW